MATQVNLPTSGSGHYGGTPPRMVAHLVLRSATRYSRRQVIRSFRDRETEALFHDRDVRRFRAIERVARRKLLLVHRAVSLQDLRVPPGNRLEELKGDRAG
jgi:hypothetical protein